MKINCKGRNHFKKVHAVSQFQNGNEEFDHQWLMAVNYKEESVNASLTVNEYDASFQLDSDFNLNTICQKHVRKHQVSPTAVLLNMWNKTNMEPLGERGLMVVNPRTRAKSEVKFVVVPNGFTNLSGLKTIQELGFITINKECFISQIKGPQLGSMKMPSRKYFLVGKFPLRLKDQIKGPQLGSMKMPSRKYFLVGKFPLRLKDP